MTDGNGNVWQTTYNSWGLVESRIEPATSAYPNALDRTFTTRYDGGGLPVLELQSGVNVTRTFDNLGRLTGESTADGANRGFAYDLANRPTTVTSGATSISLGYNERSQLVSASGSAGVSSFRYDAVGRPTQRVDAAGTTSYSWRQNGQLNQIGDPVTGTTSTYNWAAPLAANAGQLTSVSTSATARSYGYDGIGRVISDVTMVGASTLWSASYHYDTAGHVDTKTIGPAGVAGAGANSYSYNLAGQLTSWTDPAAVATAYSYDLAGNRTSNGATAIVFDQRNRIISEGTKSYAWTARGTLDSITDGASTTSYVFDGLGRMTAADGVSYSYDGLNRIINRDSTAFTYSGVHNQPTSDGTTVLSRTPDGSPLAIAEGATRLTLLADRHGDVVASMSAAGVLVDSVAYSPWGEPAARQGATALTVGFQSSYTDPTTGLIDMGARWYQASTGTFTNRDTYNGVLSTPISLNRYTYATNNPIDYFDPDGRMSADAAEKYAAKGYSCSGKKHGVDCAKPTKKKPVITKADHAEQAVAAEKALQTRIEQMERQGGPTIFLTVDPPPMPCYSTQCGNEQGARPDSTKGANSPKPDATREEVLEFVRDRRTNMLERGKQMSVGHRLEVLDQAEDETKKIAIRAIRDFTLWEIDSGRVSDSGGSTWWEATNGHMIADMEDALLLIQHGIDSGPDETVTKWIEYFLNPWDWGGEAHLEVGSLMFWDAHQSSLHASYYQAHIYYADESEGERAFINVVVGNVNFSADNNISPAAFGGELIGWGINTILDYPGYPSVGDCGCRVPGSSPMEPFNVGP